MKDLSLADLIALEQYLARRAQTLREMGSERRQWHAAEFEGYRLNVIKEIDLRIGNIEEIWK